MSEKGTTIHISEKVWKKLNALKEMGESFDSVLRRVLDIGDIDKDN